MRAARIEAVEESPLCLAIRAVLTDVADRRAEWREVEAKWRRAPDDKPEPLASAWPSSASPWWCRWVSKEIAAKLDHAPKWIAGGALVDQFEDLWGPLVKVLAKLPEMRLIQWDRLAIRWSAKPILVRDGPLTSVSIGKASIVPEKVRATTPSAPLVYLDLHLAAFLLASTDEDLLPGVHALLCSLAFEEEGGDEDGGWTVARRRPDLVGYAATLGRYGAQDAREASAIAHGMVGTRKETMRRHGFDPSTGQGLLWLAEGAAGGAP
jgi:hypothetical protein